MITSKIKASFQEEFGSITHLFTIIEEPLSSLAACTKTHVYNPGVYVFVLDNQVIKVGRHLTNSRKRALEHIRDNTSGKGVFQMKSLADKPETKVILFNVSDPKNYHWVAAVEIYLENKLEPLIKSGRTG
ncbi:hypothetical protein GCM10011414_06620 [Croceivirga lutea]|uniref:hypothetical protein n=1 Tax=Croceivirga lutea TaxID=1775167 RepID=UPI00163B2590|nr:hypothetical protein [Croceivirga lutea]GGG39836.1 hypothetical protein GCM10011414_06620 [Croceivirga lutea]